MDPMMWVVTNRVENFSLCVTHKWQLLPLYIIMYFILFLPVCQKWNRAKHITLLLCISVIPYTWHVFYFIRQAHFCPQVVDSCWIHLHHSAHEHPAYINKWRLVSKLVQLAFILILLVLFSIYLCYFICIAICIAISLAYMYKSISGMCVCVNKIYYLSASIILWLLPAGFAEFIENV